MSVVDRLDPNYEFNRIQELMNVYKPQIKIIREDIKERISTKKYGNDGLPFHRGFYCPSKIVDVMCDTSRGSLADHKDHKQTKFHYGFDQFGNLIFVKQGAELEYILRHNGVELGLSIRGGQIQRVSECEWNRGGRLKKYSLFEQFDQFSTHTIEHYTYTPDRMQVEIENYLNRKEQSLFSKEKYVFVVEDGKLKKYWSEQRSEMIYDVFIDRTID